MAGARREREGREVVQESRRRARAVIAGARQEQERVSPDERSSDSSRAENPGVIIYIQYKYRPLVPFCAEPCLAKEQAWARKRSPWRAYAAHRLLVSRTPPSATAAD